MAEQFEKTKQFLSEQLAILKKLDTDGNRRLSGDELATAMVQQWAKEHPEDKELLKLKNSVFLAREGMPQYKEWLQRTTEGVAQNFRDLLTENLRQVEGVKQRLEQQITDHARDTLGEYQQVREKGPQLTEREQDIYIAMQRRNAAQPGLTAAQQAEPPKELDGKAVTAQEAAHIRAALPELNRIAASEGPQQGNAANIPGLSAQQAQQLQQQARDALPASSAGQEHPLKLTPAQEQEIATIRAQLAQFDPKVEQPTVKDMQVAVEKARSTRER